MQKILDPKLGWINPYAENEQVQEDCLPAKTGRFAGQVFEVDDITSSQELLEFMQAGSDTSSGQNVTPKTAMSVAAVYRCVTLISNAVATLPLQLKQEIGEHKETATEHSLYRILTRKPNRWQSPSAFKRMLMAHVLLRGNGYALIVRGVGGRVIELIPLMPDQVEPVQKNDGDLVYHHIASNGQRRTYKQEEIFHLRGMSWDGIKGMSVISAAQEAVGVALATEKHGAAVFKNGAMPGSVLEHPGKLGKEGQDNLKLSLESYRGAANAHKNLILEEGMQFKPMGMTAQDTQYIETRKFTRSDIYMFFGVPPHMAGDVEKSTSWGSGIEQQSVGFVAYTLQNWLTEWEEAVNRDLLPDNELDYYARFNLKALVKGDIKTRFDAYVRSVQFGIMSPDEVRALEDLNPRGDGEGGQYYDPPNTAGEKAGGEKEEKSDDD